MGVLEIHPWGSKNDYLEKPDRIIFDLDPDESIDWKILGATAKEFRSRLEDLGLQSFLKTTGGKGLHVVAPIRPENEWPAIKEFAHNIVLGIERKNPGLYVTKMTKAIRKNRIYLDYLRNDRGSTAIAPYSTRARSGAPVALPLDWKELNAKTRPVSMSPTSIRGRSGSPPIPGTRWSSSSSDSLQRQYAKLNPETQASVSAQRQKRPSRMIRIANQSLSGELPARTSWS